jgi:hypothetical protein
VYDAAWEAEPNSPRKQHEETNRQVRIRSIDSNSIETISIRARYEDATELLVQKRQFAQAGACLAN